MAKKVENDLENLGFVKRKLADTLSLAIILLSIINCLFVCLFSECDDEEIDIYEQLAEKDNYLILAAEAGKVLLEKNQELTTNLEALQEEYAHKIEVNLKLNNFV